MQHIRAWTAAPPKVRATGDEPIEPVAPALVSTALSSQDGAEDLDTPPSSNGDTAASRADEPALQDSEGSTGGGVSDSDGDAAPSQWANAMADLAKPDDGVRRDDDKLFALMATHPCASIAKPADRINNQGSMVGVFPAQKMRSYTEETVRLFLPMLKRAKRRFPDQEPAYENAKLVLRSQLDRGGARRRPGQAPRPEKPVSTRISPAGRAVPHR
jgi:hypothetical protein